MSAAYVTYGSTDVVQLDGRAPTPLVVTAQDVQDPEKLARLLEQALRENQELRRRWAPRSIEYRDVPVDGTGSTLYAFEHRFGGRVNWEVVRWKPTTIGDPHDMEFHASSTTNRLVLVSGWAGTATIRVTEAG